jgi:manganese transport protein
MLDAFKVERRSVKRSFLKFFGPGMLVSVAYVDPGNFGTDISAGALYNYDLLWVVWMASLMAMLLQYLSGKIGIATGRSMPELMREKLGGRGRAILYWLASESFAVATDLAEFLGVALAINLLFDIPLFWAATIASFDVVAIFLLAGRRFRRIELIIAALVSVIGLGYVFEILLMRPDIIAIVHHSVTPKLSLETAPLAVGIIGATVMPHALAVHSWLTKNKIEEGGTQEKRSLLKYHLIDNVMSLSLAGLVNAAILIMAAAAFYATGNSVATVEEAYRTLMPLFGYLASFVFAITLLASGLSSSTTGVLAGQALMEGLLGSRVNPWLRRIVLRLINVVPTLLAITWGLNPLDILVYSQVTLSLLIPVPLIPIVYFSSRKELMGEFVNRRLTDVIALCFTGIILSFNTYLLLWGLHLA